MTFPFVPAFLVLLLVYVVYSEWAGLDSRFLLGAALGLLVVTAIVDAAGATATASTLSEYVIFLLAGAVVLLLVDHLRSRWWSDGGPGGRSRLRAGDPKTSEPTHERQRSTDQPFDGPEEQPVPLVHRPGREDDEHEDPRDPEPDQR